MKASKIIFISIIALIILAVPLLAAVNYNVSSNREFIMKVEKRIPTYFSNVWDAENKIQAFENFFNDRMPFRKNIITAYSNTLHSINVSLFKDIVIYGKNNYMFLAWAQDHHRGLVEYDQSDVIFATNNVKKLDDYLSEKNINFIFAVMPDKANVYPEYLPDWYTQTQAKSPNEKILDYAYSREYDFAVNLKSMYEKQKDEYGDYLYPKTDTHYTSLGAYLCYIEMMDVINAGSTDKTETLILKNYFVIPKNCGYELNYMAGLNKEVDDFKVVLEYENSNIGEDYHSYKLESSAYDQYLNENAFCDQTIMYIGDSFITAQKPFYINTYKNAYFLHIDNHIGSMRDFNLIDEIISDINPDVVILETVERYAYDRTYRMYDKNNIADEDICQ